MDYIYSVFKADDKKSIGKRQIALVNIKDAAVI